MNTEIITSTQKLSRLLEYFDTGKPTLFLFASLI